MTMPQIIETERLVLRPMALSDADAVMTHLTFDVAKYLTSVPWPYARSDAEDYLSMASTTPGLYAVTCAGDYIGAMGYETELGYWLAEPSWGQGYATEAARAVRDAAFENTDVEVDRSGFARANTASGNVLAKCGFTGDGYRTAMLNQNRERCVLRRVSLTRADWQALTAGSDTAKRQT